MKRFPATTRAACRGWARRALLFLLGALAVGVALAWHFVVAPTARTLEIANGYAAMIAAMQHTVVGDDLETIRRERLPAEFTALEIELDKVGGGAASSFHGLLRREAAVRPRMGAIRTRVAGVDLPESLPDLVDAPPADLPWPLGSADGAAEPGPDVSRAALDAAIDAAFHDPETGASNGTHAVVVIQDGRLIAERYAPAYGPSTPLLGWSMTKSVTATLVGRLVHAGALEVDAPAPVAPWTGPDDARGAITVDDLLRMQSGLSWVQNHTDETCDSLNMLFKSADCAAYAAAKPLAHEPGRTWQYSDGSSNIVARIVHDLGGADAAERMTYPQRALFAPLGMDTALICVDGAGTFVGSSLMWASARDWARLGWLYAADGVWNGARLLPEGWVDYVSSRTPGNPHGSYGAAFWRYGDEAPRDEGGRDVPAELAGVFYMAGYQDQYVFIDRARRAVVVRLGVEPEGNGFEPPLFAAAVLTALDG